MRSEAFLQPSRLQLLDSGFVAKSASRRSEPEKLGLQREGGILAAGPDGRRRPGALPVFLPALAAYARSVAEAIAKSREVLYRLDLPPIDGPFALARLPGAQACGTSCWSISSIRRADPVSS